MKQAVFCLSLDTELLWGRKNLTWQAFQKRAVVTKKIVIPQLIALFKKHSFPVTWAVVGKLLEPGSQGWSYPELVDKLKETPHQEIACHSYCHPEFTYLSPKEAEKEISICKTIAKNSKLRFTSFVFPKNKIAHLSLLKKAGFINYRGADKNNNELLFPRFPPVYQPTMKAGLVNIPGSMYLVSARGLRKYIPMSLRFLKIKLGIKHAIQKKAIFHLWFHPIDISDRPEAFLKLLENTIQYTKKVAKNQQIKVLTMNQIAENVTSKEV